MSVTNCRFYERKFPEIGDIVMVNVQQIEDMGAYVKLLEYDNLEGMVLLSELTRRRIRSVQKLIRVGKNEVLAVLRVDKEKGYIDLSKSSVSPEDAAECEERYSKGKAVHSILRHCAEKFNVPLETLYKTIGWPLSRKYGSAYDAFKLSITNPKVFESITPPSNDLLEELKTYVSRRLTPQATKIRADIEVSCFHIEGIEAIKKALKAGELLSTEHIKIKAKLIAAPLYVLSTQSLDKDKGIQLLEQAIQAIGREIEKFDGECRVKMSPKAVTANDDAELKALMENEERKAQEVSGDEDSEAE
ncbi:translation initiation factor eIF2 subunit alpha ASCRUDRAFT_32816 [Ascoidea rubescens DSM 1968]|uniref:Eukaryotic translation initiation factor 2 subunit alpha n=1 Tax=Ascoidea rubescens DSM 1968 TaxID=1344418 RepID=A0A1D2VLD7_9ASCO|nr:hypothetical protein ASCRUDRAFT_32816 [Ascoidea rubescens DSM 1968]ODV62440.1 hypothetical protein ASCRUDRAFT_32816 [Ascoidea rubescens DSM 1968]